MEMPEKHTLFKSFNVRFSLINRQHVELLQKFEKDAAAGKNSKNQIIMKALAEYYYKQEHDRKDVDLDNVLTMEMVEEKLDKMKGDIRTELYQEFMKFFAGNLMGMAMVRPVVAAQPVMQTVPQERDSMEEENSFDIEEDDVIMSNVQKWS